MKPNPTDRLLSPTCRAAAPAATLALLLAGAATGQTWALRQPAANPGSRAGAAAAFDPVTNRTLLFGGGPSAAGTLPSDTWLFDSANWAAASPAAAPAGRTGHAMATDFGRARIVLFGGHDGAAALDDTWEWNGATWTAVQPVTRPPARLAHAMAHDLLRGVTVLFGGTSTPNGPGTLRDTWQWNGTDWSQAVTANAPAQSEDAAMCYDQARGVCVLACGTSFLGSPDQSTWEFDGATWSNVTAAVGAGPSATAGLGVAGAKMVYDSSRNVAVLYGGRTPNGTHPRDTWEYDGTSWRVVGPLGPTGRTQFSMAMDAARARVVLYGGTDSSLNSLRDTWEFTPGQRAAYAVFGAGCPASAGVPSNVPTALPKIGRTLGVTIGNLPAPQVAIFTLGFSNTTSAFGPLPLSAAGLGAPGCFLRASADGTQLLLGTGGAASFQLPIPNRTALVGTQFYTSAIVLAPGTNALGAVVADAAAATVGY